MQTRKSIFLILTIIAGIFLLQHHLYYQPLLSQGDHGRDLYAAQMTLKGAVPYRDYWWVYGPLMPYYYALFFKIFGINIKSVLLGKLVLNLLSGIFFFLILSPLIPPLFVFAGTLWFLLYNLDFFFTYNHVGGITCLMAIVYCLFLYMRSKNKKYLYPGLVLIFILSLIKVNFGLVALFLFLLTIFIHDEIYEIPFTRQKGILVLTAAFGLPLLVFLIYSFLFHGYPEYVVRQCLPYLKGDQPYEASIGQTLWAWWQAIALNINNSWPNRFFAIILISSITQVFYNIYTNKFEKPFKHEIIFAIGIFVAFYIFNLHEYLVSGVIYRAFWSQPFSIMMIFLFLGAATHHYSKYIKLLVTIILFTLYVFYLHEYLSPFLNGFPLLFWIMVIPISLVIGLYFYPQLLRFLLVFVLFTIIFFRYQEQIEIVKAKKLPEQYLALERGQIITGNEWGWFATVEQTTEFLQTHLKKDETFFALPYDVLYYYLTDKPSPSRQLIFFEHIKIPPEQEHSVVSEIEKKNVNYILLSNRIASGEPGLGVLGKTYCPILGEYIRDNFQPIAMFGDWVDHPGWAWSHGTQILKRIDRSAKIQ